MILETPELELDVDVAFDVDVELDVDVAFDADVEFDVDVVLFHGGVGDRSDRVDHRRLRQILPRALQLLCPPHARARHQHRRTAGECMGPGQANM